MKLTILIAAKHIPNNSQVFKATGTYPHILRDKIKVYKENSVEEIIESVGCKYMISSGGNITAISEALVLKWETDLSELNSLFDEESEE
jgi:hypothetical protein